MERVIVAVIIQASKLVTLCLEVIKSA